MKKRRMIISLAVAISMAWTMLFTFTLPVDAASKKWDLPESATVYTLKQDEHGNNIQGQWEVNRVDRFKYNKRGYIVRYDASYFPDSSSPSLTTEKTKWTVKRGKISKRTVKHTFTSGSEVSGSTATAKYTKGKLKKETRKGGLSGGKYTSSYSYNKRGWITKSTDKHGSVKYHITYHKNGMPKKISVKYGSVLQYVGSQSYTMYFNKKGLMTKRLTVIGDAKVMLATSTGDVAGKGGDAKDLFSYSYDKKGRVSSVSMKEYIDGKYIETRRVIYKYGKKKTSDKRLYFGIMNRHTPAAAVCKDLLPGELASTV